jgi:outer membrane protein OmpA-like peptidoglycan-associated protein
LNFRFESDALTDQSRALLPEILRVVRDRPFANVAVTGHTDTMGTPEVNYELGLKRASTVRKLLIEAGLDVAQIDVSSLGETDPLVRTADHTAEPRNRRVDIAVR